MTTRTEEVKNDLNYIFTKAIMCEHDHGIVLIHRTGFCDRCLDDLAKTAHTRQDLHLAEFTLSETELCALFRQTFRNHIPWEGVSGPVLHGLLTRLRSQIGASRYSEYVDGAFPDRLKPPETGLNLSQK